MELTFAIGYLGLAVLALGAILVGILFYLVGDPQFSYEWVGTAIGAFIGGFVASEFIIAFQGWEPVYDGLALAPALIGGLIVGGLVAAVTRFVTREPLAATGR